MKHLISIVLFLLVFCVGIRFDSSDLFLSERSLNLEAEGSIPVFLEQIPVVAPNGDPDAVRETTAPIPPEVLKSDRTLIFGGDVLLDGAIAEKINRGGGYEDVMSLSFAEMFSRADLAVVNLEQPFSTRGTPVEDKQYTFRGIPGHLKFLSEYMDVGAVSLANNHVLDYGTDAMLDTLLFLEEYGIGYAGAGEDLEAARKPYVAQWEGMTVTLIGASRVVPTVDWHAWKNHAGVFTAYDPKNLLAVIREASEVSDTVVVYLHWGTENTDVPEEYQVALAHSCIEAGADVVVGAHPHVIQPLEFYQGKLIAYSLGNLIFPSTDRDTMALEITLGQDGLVPRMYFGRIAGRKTDLVTDADKWERLRSMLEGMSPTVFIDREGYITPR